MKIHARMSRDIVSWKSRSYATSSLLINDNSSLSTRRLGCVEREPTAQGSIKDVIVHCSDGMDRPKGTEHTISEHETQLPGTTSKSIEPGRLTMIGNP